MSSRVLPRWLPEVLSMELRKLLSYRTDFWVGFLGSIVAHLCVAYFLWKAIFTYRQVDQLNGFSFHGLMLYYLLVPTIDRLVRGLEMGFVSTEIYDGSLSRYLAYPLSFYQYKYVCHLSLGLFSMLQLLLAFAIFAFFIGIPADFHLTPANFALGLTAGVLAGYLYFSLSSILEMVAFWADNVWALVVMLRFSISLLGGGFVPLAFFPEWAGPILNLLPFPYLLSFPIRTILGQVTFSEWCMGCVMILLWAGLFTTLSRAVWRRGLLQYSGVGI